ncbi:hypothetical protein JCM19233_6799 [Vibrio astriarenae]|nr:hypothetical protein JCM19233_6799 [Vibrio sp. C7]
MTDVHVVKHGDEIPKPSCPNGMSLILPLALAISKLKKSLS